MKKFFLLIVYGFILTINCYLDVLPINDTFRNGIKYYFDEIIPTFYKGHLKEDVARSKGHRKYKIGMQGDGDGGLHYFFMEKENKNLMFNFYFLINHDRQDVQCINLFSETVNNELFEYWVFRMADIGTPYNYEYFSLTKANSLESRREIIDISTQYKNEYILGTGELLNLEINNLMILYQIRPWVCSESYIGTIYENKIVKFKGNTPYLRDMNIFEKFYYNNMKKSIKRI